MVSQRLRKILLISIFVFFFHGIEEYLTGFYNIDSTFRAFVVLFDPMSLPQDTFLLLQATVLLLLLMLFLVTSSNKKTTLSLMTLVGVAYVLESSHFIEAIKVRGYYPGLITAFLFIPIGFYFWNELIKEWRKALVA